MAKKKTEKKPDKIVQERHRYDFTDQERSALGLKLARATRELDDLNEQKKDATKAIAEEIAETRKHIRRLTSEINDGWELRLVEVGVFLNVPKNGMKRKVRLDTGELVSEEPMSDEERQMLIPGIECESETLVEATCKIVDQATGNGTDPLLEDAIRTVQEAGRVSTSLLQHELRVGYARAAHLIDLMEARAIVGPANGLAPRDLLVKANAAGVGK